MSIGLDYVKKNDKNWHKHIISIDRMNDERYFDKPLYRYKEDFVKSNPINIEKNHDLWKFWKKRYLIIR